MILVQDERTVSSVIWTLSIGFAALASGFEPSRAVKASLQQGGEHSASIELPDRGMRIDCRLYLPPHINTARIVLVIAPRGLGDNLYADADVRAFAASLPAALLVPQFVNVAGVKGTLTAAARAEALVASLKQFAAQLNAPDLASAPLIFWGHSVGASIGTDVAPVLAVRTVAVVRYHASERGDVAALKQFPILFFKGGKDSSYDNESPGSLWRQGRAEGAPWTYAIEPDAQHGDADAMRRATTLLLPWIHAVVQRRSPDGSGQLRAISGVDSWLGDPATGRAMPSAAFTGMKSEASWLPDEQTARAWQSLIGRSGREHLRHSQSPNAERPSRASW
jgi:hypothetical protein